jgi:hypothetical protein
LRLFDVKYDPIKTIKNGAIGVQTGAHAPVGGQCILRQALLLFSKIY